MLKLTVRLLASLFAVASISCGGKAQTTAGQSGNAGTRTDLCAAGPSDACPEKSLLLYTWMGEAERPAHDALFNVVRERVPGIQINAWEPPNTPNHGNMPAFDSFRVITGEDLRQLATTQTALHPIDDLADAENWWEAFPRPVLDSLSVDGHLYGVPLFLEQDNTLFFNAELLRRAGLKPPRSVNELFTVADALKSKGIAPLTIPTKAGWSIASILFESLVIAQAGPHFYDQYLRGGGVADAPEIKDSIEILAKLLDYVEPAPQRAWNECVSDLCNGNATMLLLPNFVKQHAQETCPHIELDYVPVYGAKPTFVFVGGGFVLPKDAPHPFAARAFLRAVGSVRGQETFNAVRGSMSPRMDVAPEGFDPLTQQTMRDYQAPDATFVQAYAALTTTAFQESFNPALQRFCDPSTPDYKNADAVLQALKTAYPYLSRR